MSIPYISGPYTRLVLHGNINVNQVKRLVNPNVQQVRISAALEMLKEEYNDFAEFVAQQTYGFNRWYVFMIGIKVRQRSLHTVYPTAIAYFQS
uniref:Phage protein n=1 Tax=Panagrellus redivivus TaxID=6233 RepID=A0A7E4UYW0_PANRE